MNTTKSQNPQVVIDVEMLMQMIRESNRKNRPSEWPKLVGSSAHEAELTIKKDRPTVSVEIVMPNMVARQGFSAERVCVFVDSSGKVVQVPKVG